MSKMNSFIGLLCLMLALVCATLGISFISMKMYLYGFIFIILTLIIDFVMMVFHIID
ncbi:hypothetical protein [Clostridium sp.]|uniref:hypothetical protein n=1 Tax=Clostridium sp. TaxID=1506 RepID=UPI00260FA14C|nr:hypothetical protein [Clostridium sp.]